MKEQWLDKRSSFLKYLLYFVNLSFILLLVINYFDKIPPFWNINYLFFSTILVNFFIGIVSYEQSIKFNKDPFIFVKQSQNILLFFLLLILVNQIFKNKIGADLFNYFLGFCLLGGAITFYKLKEKISQEITKERVEEGLFKKYVNIVKEENKKTWLIVLGIILLNFIVKIIIAYRAEVDSDEIYTYSVVQGFWRYFTLNLAASGAYYDNSEVYHFFAAITYKFFRLLHFDNILALRMFNIIFWSIFLIFFYISLRDLFNKKTSILILVLVNIAWLLNSIIITARSYTFYIVFAYLSVYFLSKSLYTKDLRFGFIALFFAILNFFTGHILGLYHFIPVYLIYLIMYLKQRTHLGTRLYLVLTSALVIGSISYYIIYVRSSFFEFILKVIKYKIYTSQLPYLFSHYTYYHYFSITLFFLSIIAASILLLNRKKSVTSYFLGFSLAYSLIVIITHMTFVGSRTNFYKYLIDISIFLIIFFVVLLSYLKEAGDYKIIMLIVVSLFILSNLYNIHNLYEQNINPMTLKDEITFRKIQSFVEQQENKTYALIGDSVLFYGLNDKEVAFYKITRNSFESFSLEISTKDEAFNKKTNMTKIYEYLEEEESSRKYLLNNATDLDVFFSTPRIEYLEELKELIEKHGQVYVFLSHNYLDKIGIDVETEKIYLFLENNCNLENYKSIKSRNTFNDQYSYSRNMFPIFCHLNKSNLKE